MMRAHFKTSPTRKRGLNFRSTRSPRSRVGLVILLTNYDLKDTQMANDALSHGINNHFQFARLRQRDVIDQLQFDLDHRARAAADFA